MFNQAQFKTKSFLYFVVSEFTDLYHKEDTYDPAMSMFDFAGGPCYDHIWVAALALNCTDAYMKKIGKEL